MVNFMKAPSQRQLKVGEEIRHVLSSIFLRGDLPGLGDFSITVGEVRVSPDLKHATAYVMPLGGVNAEGVFRSLKTLEPHIRTMVTREIRLKFSPQINFKLDESYDNAAKIDDLLNRIQG